MDYFELAKEMMQNMQLLSRAGQQKSINDCVHGEAFVLYFVKQKQGGIVPGDISEAMGISTARVAAALNSLEGKGYVTREIDKGDRRRIIVKLTPEGREYADEQEKFYMGMITEMLTALGERDAAEYVRITGKLAAIMNSAKPFALRAQRVD